MENIYHDYWDQELMYQFLTEDKCKKKAYVCSPFWIIVNKVDK